MKEKIRQLAKENFEYDPPNILLSEESLDITVEEGSFYTGSFRITNSGEVNMKGVVYCFDNNVRITNAMFIGKNSEIQFIWDAKKAEAGQNRQEKFYIVSSLGEIELPYSVKITEAFAASSLGKMNDLFRFANLARGNWEEARLLFCSPEFSGVFLKTEESKSLYKSLMKSRDTDLAMEEFLIANQKKLKPDIEVIKTFRVYEYKGESFSDKIMLKKDNWGYERIGISVIGDFISVDKREINTRDFIGNNGEIEYILDGKPLKPGIHYGKIKLETLNETIEVKVKFIVKRKGEPSLYSLKKEKTLKLMQSYLSFRTNQIAYDTYITELAGLITETEAVFSFGFHALLKIHYLLMERQPSAQEELKALRKKEKELLKESKELYSAYLYLGAMVTKKEKDISRAIREISSFYEEEPHKWQFFWFLLYLDEKYEKEPEKKWKALREAIENGVHSPVIYFEACECLKKDKKAKKVFAPVLMKILAYGIRMDYLNEGEADLYCFFAEEAKATPALFKTLSLLYEETEKKEALIPIIKLLIQEEKKDPKYFKWFRLGEEAHLRIENMYEYYIYTMEEDFEFRIPSSLFTYFQYDNTLTDDKKAFLYAYIIANKSRERAVFSNYDKVIEEFAMEQVKKERIDRNLKIIYEEYIRVEEMTHRLALSLSSIMFRYELVCENPKITGVYITHKELEKESFAPLHNGAALVDISTESPVIVFCDNEGCRYAKTVKYKLTRLFHIHRLALKCYEYCKNNTYLLINLFERINKYQKNNEDSISVQRKCALYPGFSGFYKGQCLTTLITYYFEHMETDALKEILLLTDFSLLEGEFRKKAIQYLMIYELTDKAWYCLREYGFAGIAIHRLIRICTEEIKKQEGMDIFLLKMAYYVFQEEKYNEEILTYLVHYLEADTKVLLKLWKRAKNFDINTYDLEERMLTQMLFCESYVNKAYGVFTSYYEKSGNETLIKAFLSFNAYKYLMNERIIGDDMFEIMKKGRFYEENKTIQLALLRDLSKKEKLEEDEAAFCEKMLEEETKEGRVFPFFKDFSGKVKLPQEILPYYYVQYKCNPDKKVNIHYIRGEEKEREAYQTEEMEDIFHGIHVMKFLLFQDESLAYYITEEKDGIEVITESAKVDMENLTYIEEDSVYGLINLIILAGEMKDEKAMLAFMEYYVKFQYTCGELLKIL